MSGSIPKKLVAALAAVMISIPSLAQAPTARLRGVIDAVVGTNLDIASREGPLVALRLAEGTRLAAVVKAALSDIRPGSYVGIAAVPQPDGSQLALEVLIFPESMRGAGEGHRPWDLTADSTMTNATVADIVAKVEGEVLTLTYKDGRKTIVVPPQAPVVTFAPATRDELKPGVRIFSSTVTASDGVTTAASIVIGRDGVDPPM